MSYVADQGLVGAYILDEVIDGAVGIVEEFRHDDPNDNRTRSKKTLTGLIRGTTPIPLISGLYKKGAHLNYEKDSAIYVQFPEKLLEDLFRQIPEQATTTKEPETTNITTRINGTITKDKETTPLLSSGSETK